MGHATTWGGPVAFPRIGVGNAVDDRSFADDWVLVHEMLHTALPDLPRRALWMQEGNATWVEPVIRAQAGWIDPQRFWRDAVEGLPRGLHGAAQGLDGTRDHDALYWGGALFWFLAELELAKVEGKAVLWRALRAINRDSGGNGADWDPETLIRRGDRAIGGDTLARLYRRFASGGMPIELAALFETLGVLPADGGGVRLVESAPGAAIRRAITAPLPESGL